MRTAVTRLVPVLFALALTASTPGQSMLEDLPGYERYREINRSGNLARGGTISRVRWSDDGSRLTFRRSGDWYAFDLDEGTVEQIDEPAADEDRAGRSGRGRRPGRGRQRSREASPDGAWVAVCRDWNVLLEDESGSSVTEITADGDRKHRYGVASWVYGEELRQRSAMWWAPDSSRLAFYEFDEREVPDYHLLGGWTDLRTKVMLEGYPKPGEANPIARLHLYEVETARTVQVETGPSGAEDIGHYVYAVRFAPDGQHLLFHRTNRHQNTMELVAADVVTGSSRVIVRETQETWQKNRPSLRFLEDGQRFIWETERSGFRHYELRTLDGGRLATLTSGDYPVGSIVRVDEDRGLLYYTAFSGDHPLNAHLHRVGLDGEGDTRLTPLGENHSGFEIAPDGEWFIATAQAIDTAPATSLHDAEGEVITVLAESDTSRVEDLGLRTPELFSFLTDDAATRIYGVLHKPSSFDPRRRYPLLIDVYGGPQSQRVRNTFQRPQALCELGFIVARIDNRGTGGRGKAFESANYLELGGVDLLDQVEGVRALGRRPYIDDTRVGIFGHSYGGYLSALAILKYPEVFHVAVASSPVTDWRNYDTIYTERYMRTPEENPEGYDQGSCMTFAEQLQGKLLIMHGMIDDNVHPTNLWQLADALHEAGKPFDMMVYPKSGHGLGRTSGGHRVEYLYRHLIGKLEF